MQRYHPTKSIILMQHIVPSTIEWKFNSLNFILLCAIHGWWFMEKNERALQDIFYFFSFIIMLSCPLRRLHFKRLSIEINKNNANIYLSFPLFAWRPSLSIVVTSPFMESAVSLLSSSLAWMWICVNIKRKAGKQGWIIVNCCIVVTCVAYCPVAWKRE